MCRRCWRALSAVRVTAVRPLTLGGTTGDSRTTVERQLNDCRVDHGRESERRGRRRPFSSAKLSSARPSAGPVSAGQVSSGQVSSGQVSAGQVSSGQVSAGPRRRSRPDSSGRLRISGLSRRRDVDCARSKSNYRIGPAANTNYRKEIDWVQWPAQL